MNNDGGPAFPCVTESLTNDDFAGVTDSGMTLRDYFAIRAPEPSKESVDLQRRIDENKNPYNEPHKPPRRSADEIRADLAYQYADAMLKARQS